MQPNFVIHQLFPILVYQGKIENHAAYKQIFMGKFDQYGFDPNISLKSNGSQTLTGEYRGLCLLHKDPTFAPFFADLTFKIREYLSYLGVDDSQFDINIIKSWFTIIENDSAMQFHIHCSSDMSFVYYLDTSGTSGNIVFERPKESYKFLDFFHDMFSRADRNFIKNTSDQTPPYYDCIPNEGSLLLFHSNLYHGVRADPTGKRRISIAGDIKLTLKQPILNRESGLMSPENWQKF